MKGVSQVLTSAIILAVAVSVAGVYSNWAPGFAEDLAGGAGEDINKDIRCGNAALTIDTAEYDLSGNFTEIAIRNSGTIDLRSGVEVVVFNDRSQILGKKVIDSIGATETRQIQITSDDAPARMAASSRDCPGNVVVSTDTIRVTE